MNDAALLRAIRFLATGGLGFALDAALLLGLSPTLGPIWAQILAYAVATVVTFLLNKLWTFTARGPQWAAEGSRYLALSVAGALAINGLYAAAVLMGVPPLLALVVCATSWALVSYTLMGRWVFKPSSLSR